MTISVALVDDEAMIRAGLRMMLSGEPGIEVVGEAADGVAALELVARTRPDVVLLDMRMPRMDGLEAAHRLVRDHPGSKVVVLTTFDEDEPVARPRCRWQGTRSAHHRPRQRPRAAQGPTAGG